MLHFQDPGWGGGNNPGSRQVVIAEKWNLADPFPVANPANFNRTVSPRDFNPKFALDDEIKRICQRSILYQGRSGRHFPFAHECCQKRSILDAKTMCQFRESIRKIDHFHSRTP